MKLVAPAMAGPIAAGEWRFINPGTINVIHAVVFPDFPYFPLLEFVLSG